MTRSTRRSCKGVSQITLIIDEAHKDDMFVVVRNLKILGAQAGEDGGRSSPLRSSARQAITGKKNSQRRKGKGGKGKGAFSGGSGQAQAVDARSGGRGGLSRRLSAAVSSPG